MTQFNMRKVVTALSVILIGAGIYFILPEKMFIIVSEKMDTVQIKVFISAFISATIASIFIVYINPKNFFDKRESSGIIVAILIASIFLCAILWKRFNKCREFLCIFLLKSFEKQWENNNNNRYVFIWNLEYGKKYKII